MVVSGELSVQGVEKNASVQKTRCWSSGRMQSGVSAVGRRGKNPGCGMGIGPQRPAHFTEKKQKQDRSADGERCVCHGKPSRREEGAHPVEGSGKVKAWGRPYFSQCLEAPLTLGSSGKARAFLTQKHASSCRVDRARGDPSTRALLSPEAWHTSLLAPRIQASPRLVLSPKSLAKPEREPTLGQTPPRPRSFVQLLLTTPHTPSWVLRDPGEPGPWPGGGTGHSMHREAQSQQGHEGNLGASHRVSEAPGRV